jgi:serine protease Do
MMGECGAGAGGRRGVTDYAEDDLNANTHRNKSRAVALAATADATARARFAVKLAIAAALTILALVWAQQAFARSAPESFADLAAQALPAVVNVSSTQKVPQDQQMQGSKTPPRSWC